MAAGLRGRIIPVHSAGAVTMRGIPVASGSAAGGKQRADGEPAGELHPAVGGGSVDNRLRLKPRARTLEILESGPLFGSSGAGNWEKGVGFLGARVAGLAGATQAGNGAAAEMLRLLPPHNLPASAIHMRQECG